MDHFRDHNGILTNALSVDKVGDMLLRRSPCSRTAEGPETDVEREIKDNDVGLSSFGSRIRNQSYLLRTNFSVTLRVLLLLLLRLGDVVPAISKVPLLLLRIMEELDMATKVVTPE